jgi:large subunit ribosomal protein L30
MAKVKVTQVKSFIDRPKSQKDTIIALGLGKINRSKVHTVNPQIEGMIAKVAHLITVENID